MPGATAHLHEREYSAQQKVAYVLRLILSDGLAYRTCDIARMFGMTWYGADRMMVRIAEPAQLTKDPRGYWIKS